MRPQHETALDESIPMSPARVLEAYPPRTLWGDVWRRYCRQRLAMAGTVVMVILSVATLVGPMVYSVPIADIDFAVKLTGPSLAHPFGTDDRGPDVVGCQRLSGHGAILGALPWYDDFPRRDLHQLHRGWLARCP